MPKVNIGLYNAYKHAHWYTVICASSCTLIGEERLVKSVGMFVFQLQLDRVMPTEESIRRAGDVRERVTVKAVTVRSVPSVVNLKQKYINDGRTTFLPAVVVTLSFLERCRLLGRLVSFLVVFEGRTSSFRFGLGRESFRGSLLADNSRHLSILCHIKGLTVVHYGIDNYRQTQHTHINTTYTSWLYIVGISPVNTDQAIKILYHTSKYGGKLSDSRFPRIVLHNFYILVPQKTPSLTSISTVYRRVYQSQGVFAILPTCPLRLRV